jgi:hypothetical protein
MGEECGVKQYTGSEGEKDDDDKDVEVFWLKEFVGVKHDDDTDDDNSAADDDDGEDEDLDDVCRNPLSAEVCTVFSLLR